MPKKTFKVKDESGAWIDLDPSEVQVQPIIHRSLPDALLSRIRTAYDALREVITSNDHPMCLEEFELGFMREIDPAASVLTWETIASAYQRSIEYFPLDTATRSTVYQWIILLVMGAVTDEEKQKEEVQIIRKCFAEAFYIRKAA